MAGAVSSGWTGTLKKHRSGADSSPSVVSTVNPYKVNASVKRSKEEFVSSGVVASGSKKHQTLIY